jgi:hypothetical protein
VLRNYLCKSYFEPIAIYIDVETGIFFSHCCVLCDSSSYEWQKNGERLNVNGAGGVLQMPHSGTIEIKIDELRSQHDGVYQCFARNEFGIAVSIKTTLKKASTYIYTLANLFIQQFHGFFILLMRLSSSAFTDFRPIKLARAFTSGACV